MLGLHHTRAHTHTHTHTHTHIHTYTLVVIVVCYVVSCVLGGGGGGEAGVILWIGLNLAFTVAHIRQFTRQAHARFIASDSREKWLCGFTRLHSTTGMFAFSLEDLPTSCHAYFKCRATLQNMEIVAR